MYFICLLDVDIDFVCKGWTDAADLIYGKTTLHFDGECYPFVIDLLLCGIVLFF